MSDSSGAVSLASFSSGQQIQTNRPAPQVPESIMAKEKTFQFVLTATECKLFRLLRELEADFQTECPMIYHDADPKLFVKIPSDHLSHS